MMIPIWRYLRSSRRVLGFVFVASVIWLLLDMAVLRMSDGDANSRLMREKVILEQGLARHQDKVTQGGLGQPHVNGEDEKSDRRNSQPVKLSRRRKKEQVQDDASQVKPNAVVQDDASQLKPNAVVQDDASQVKPNAVVKQPVGLSLIAAPKNDSIALKAEEVLEPVKATPNIRLQASNRHQDAKTLPGKKKKQIEELPVQGPRNTSSVKGDKQNGEILDNNLKVVQVRDTHSVKASVHQVLSIDLTAAPRDPKAVGQYGLAGTVPSEMDSRAKKRWHEGHFNVYLSELIPLDRALPDTRPEICTRNMIHDDLPSTSVIFCFVDEVWSTLLRSVHSVLNRSPPHLLKEIILVDDFSKKPYLKDNLDKYMEKFPKVRVIHLKERQGLIRARMAGAAVAKGDVLTFLDSHVECNVGWLEPLLERIHTDRTKVPCPVIEVISDQDLSYKLVDNFQRGIFHWPLVFGWNALSEEYVKKNNMTPADPIRCPVMAGGLFSIDKKYFYELGAYDPGLEVWGGENMELSFKVWMCGGQIEIIPCSRVGHIFREQNPYQFPFDRRRTVERNLARVAEVWMDEYKELFYGHGNLHLLDKPLMDIGNLTEQIQQRNKLKCKSFKWYLDNVYPELEAPLVKAAGLVFNRGLRSCLSIQNGVLVFDTCHLSSQRQHFNYTWLKQVRQQDVCLEPGAKQSSLTLQPCGGSSSSSSSSKSHKPQRWLHKSSQSKLPEHLMVEMGSKQMCLEAAAKEAVLHLAPCNANNLFQQWQFTNYYSE
ncbi:polypeptide N-acetylgalactosaminyltransferase 5 isoform X2 [Syngnathus acus]|uniref:polypeptide N-acetylgalactosaminyltransferase 5 isoform X2 n=1 Tax=Syngnathus acus TaxID=161584 RepID=UPI001885D8C8|nr:polypeptide N-acetylgalactosaminyltransferase 5 isoform X2 [Syngnathus acus]